MSQGSTGNVIAALASFFVPGLGQLLQGRVGSAIVFFLIAAFFWGLGFLLGALTFGFLAFIGGIGHILAALSCALWKPKTT
jgi:TM2 domain-containing membrane protein YozV